MTLIRRMRGVAVSATTWSILFAAVGLVRLGVYSLLGTPFPPGPGSVARLVQRVALEGALTGLASGALFTAIVIATERRRDFAELSGRRFALWGFGAGVLFIGGANVAAAIAGRLPFDLSALVGTAFYGAVGAGIGAGTFWLARRHATDRHRSGITSHFPAAPSSAKFDGDDQMFVSPAGAARAYPPTVG